MIHGFAKKHRDILGQESYSCLCGKIFWTQRELNERLYCVKRVIRFFGKFSGALRSLNLKHFGSIAPNRVWVKAWQAISLFLIIIGAIISGVGIFLVLRNLDSNLFFFQTGIWLIGVGLIGFVLNVCFDKLFSQNSHGQKPENVFTDAWRAYRDGIAKTLGQVNHVAKCGISKPHANNNRIERANQTVRMRTKVQRGWKSMNTQIPEGFRIHYNFVNSHMSLSGQTPAECAGIGIKGENKWLTMLLEAQKPITQSETPQ